MIVLLFLALLALGAAPAHAEERLHFGLGGGICAPIGANAGAFESGRLAHGFFKAKLPFARLEPRLDFRTEYVGVSSVAALSPAQNLAVVLAGHQDAFGGLLELQFDLATGGRFTPYVVGGAGTTLIGAQVNTVVLPPYRTVDRNSVYGFTLAGGLGAEFRLGTLSAFAEAQYVHVNWRADANAMWLPFRPTQTVPITLGLEL